MPVVGVVIAPEAVVVIIWKTQSTIMPAVDRNSPLNRHDLNTWGILLSKNPFRNIALIRFVDYLEPPIKLLLLF